MWWSSQNFDAGIFSQKTDVMARGYCSCKIFPSSQGTWTSKFFSYVCGGDSCPSPPHALFPSSVYNRVYC